MYADMQSLDDIIIDGLGGTSAVANLIEAPTSTVHSWRKIGIPRSRLAHMKLAAEAKGIEWPVIAPDDAAASPDASPGMSPKNSGAGGTGIGDMDEVSGASAQAKAA
jgi:hypothetical protein